MIKMHPSIFLSILAVFLVQQPIPQDLTIPAFSSPEGLESSLQVSLREEKLPGATFSIVFKFQTEKTFSAREFKLEEPYGQEWELLSAGKESISRDLDKNIHVVPFILRAKKSGDINIPTLEVSALLDTKLIKVLWTKWLIPEYPFPFKELDIDKKNILKTNDKHPSWLAGVILIIIAGGTFILISQKSTPISSKSNSKKVLDMWINKIDNSSIEECINVIEPIIRSEIGLKTSLKTDSITSDDLESKIIEGISQSEKQLFVKTLQTIEKIKYSNHKDLDLLKTTVKELAESL